MVEGEPLRRARWRMRGAWMWPGYVVFTVLDGVLLHLLPVQSDKARLGPTLLVAAVLNIALLALLAPGAGRLVRRRRRELPPLVARDYAGTALLALGAAGVLAAGLLHRPEVNGNREARDLAVQAAGDFTRGHAPVEFRDNSVRADTVTLEARVLYRVCVPSPVRARVWCVLVRTDRRAPRVTYSSREPNDSFTRVR